MTNPKGNNESSKGPKRRKIFFYSAISFLIIACIGWFMLDRWAKGHGFSGAGDFVKTVTVNYWTSLYAEYETIEITLSENDFQKLSEQREKHLQKGMITKVEDRYVPAIITENGKKIKCRIRLKGHMTDHLQNKKWSFRVKTTKGDAFKGMRIFSLMHPGTRNYIYEWIYHRLLNEEGIATVRYSFLNLKVNGESWGIYAVEENFASELIAHNELPDGPIIGFNPDIYWYARLNEHERKPVDLSNMKFLGTFPEAYDEDEWLKNKENQKKYAEALAVFNKFTNGELTTSQAFDIDKLAKFHAILDLVGGQFSLDWSDVKYYYNPVTQKIEPVGYESFSVRNTAQLGGAFRFNNNSSNNSEWHDKLFSDPEYFALYVKHLLRISKTPYLDSFFERQQKEMQNNLAILWAEFPYKKLLLDGYYKNQENIITLVNTPLVPVFYLEEVKNDSLKISVGNTGGLPIEIRNIISNKVKAKLIDPVYCSARKKDEVISFETIWVPFEVKEDFNDEKIELTVAVPGISKETTVKVKPVATDNTLNNFYSFNWKKSNMSEFDFITVDEEHKRISFKRGEFNLNKDLIIPKGYLVSASSPLKLNFENNASFISYSTITFIGTEEDPILITSTDSTGKGILIIQAENSSSFKFVDFLNLGGSMKKSDVFKAIFTVYESEAKIISCNFSSDAPEGITITRGKIWIDNSSFYNFKTTGINAQFADLTILNSKIKSGSKNGISLDKSKGVIKNCRISELRQGINAANGSSVKGSNIIISNAEAGIISTDKSKVDLKSVSLNRVKLGFKAEKKSDVYGPAEIIISGLKSKDVKILKQSDNKSKIQIR